MTTFLDVQTRIATDFLNRTDFTPQIKNAINATIRNHRRQRFWFLETATALSCVVSVETVALPTNFFAMQELDVRENSNDTELISTTFVKIRELNTNLAATPGLPTHYCLYGNNIRLASVPNSAYPLQCYYLKTYQTLSADADTNKWLSAAEDLVVYGAAKLVWAFTIRNTSAAGACAQLESTMLSELKREGEQHQTHKIKSTRF